jgi:hypothetical protein
VASVGWEEMGLNKPKCQLGPDCLNAKATSFCHLNFGLELAFELWTLVLFRV